MADGNTLVLPDSRLAAPKCTVMCDWPMPDATTRRIEAEPIYCANCGKFHGYVPRENTTFAFWLCEPCYEKFGAIAGLTAVPDEEFWQKVHEEMQRHYGRDLTASELAVMNEQDLPLALQLLLRESPTRTPR